ncbi:hypothetical protein BH11PSE6_BH11PSE6_16680 [soil metagenome]
MRKFVMMATTATMMAGFGLAPQVAQAQAGIEGRVGKLESEMRAVQRKVFPGARGQLVEPDITAAAPTQVIPGSPSGTPVADLYARLNALEAQMTSMTGQIETNQYGIRELERAFEAYKRTVDARLKALEEGAGPTGATAGSEPQPFGTPARPPVATKPAAGKPSAATVEKPTTPSRDPARAQKIAALERPATDDPAEDAYLYGYRLWQGQFYPEAQVQLKKVVATYPKHKRASFAQNLLGRAYRDEGKPSLASIAFYENYKKMPDGERAPDSLYYLAQSLMKLGKPADACKVYGELGDVYGARISATMKADITRGRTEAKCK